MKEEKTDTFLLLPLIFNHPSIDEKIEGVYTITIPLSELNAFNKSDFDFHDWLMVQYNELYFVQDKETSNARYSYYIGKMFEQKLLKEES